VAAAAAEVKAFVIESVAVATCEWNEAETPIWNLPTLKGFSPMIVARPVDSEVTVMDRDPFEKITLGPSFGAVKVTVAPATGRLLRSRTSTTGFTAVFFLMMLIPRSPFKIKICSPVLSGGSSASVPGSSIDFSNSGRGSNLEMCVWPQVTAQNEVSSIATIFRDNETGGDMTPPGWNKVSEGPLKTVTRT
jgi:hypothetical protein